MGKSTISMVIFNSYVNVYEWRAGLNVYRGYPTRLLVTAGQQQNTCQAAFLRMPASTKRCPKRFTNASWVVWYHWGVWDVSGLSRQTWGQPPNGKWRILGNLAERIILFDIFKQKSTVSCDTLWSPFLGLPRRSHPSLIDVPHFAASCQPTLYIICMRYYYIIYHIQNYIYIYVHITIYILYTYNYIHINYIYTYANIIIYHFLTAPSVCICEEIEGTAWWVPRNGVQVTGKSLWETMGKSLENMGNRL